MQQFNAALSGLIAFAQKVVNALGKIFGWQMEVNAKGVTIDDEAIDDGADAMGDLADAADSAAQSTKELNKQLQGFDKLNVLTTQKDKSSSKKKNDDKNKSKTGAGIVDTGDAIASLKKTKGVFESEIDNLFDLGRYISDTLSKQMEKIEWNKVYEKARGFGAGLANFLNGLITPRLFYNVGRTISSSISTAFHFLDSFGQTFHWDNFGRSIGAGINGFLAGFDWATIKSAAHEWGSGIAETIMNAVETTDFHGIGEALMHALDAALTFAFDLGAGIDFNEVGRKLADGINGAIENFPAKKFANTINTWVQGLWDMLVSCLSHIHWDDLGEKIRQFVGNIDPKTWRILIGGLLLIKGASFALSIGSALLTEICRQFCIVLASKLTGYMATDAALQGAIGTGLGEAAAAAGGAGAAGAAGAGAAEAAGAGAAVEGVGAAAGTAAAPIAALIALIGSLVIGLGYVFATSEQVRQGFSDAVATIQENLQPAMQFMTDTVLPDIQSGFQGLLDILSPLGDLIYDVFKSIWIDMINPGLEYLGSTILPLVTDTFKDLWNNVLVPLGKFLGDVFRPIIDVISKVLGMLWKNVIVPLAKAVGTILGGAFEIIATIFKNVIIPVVSKVIDVLSFLWNKVLVPVGKFVADVLGPVFETAFNAIGEVIGNITSIFQGLIDFIAGVFSGDWKRAWEGIKKVFKGIWDTLASIVKVPINLIIALFEGLANGIIGAFNAVKRAINKLHFTVPDWVPGIGGEEVGFNLKMTEKLKIPRLAKGGFLPHGSSMFVAGEHGIPELMGTVNGKNAVAGGAEITGIRDEIHNSSNRQLANDQRIIQLLTIIAEKEFGISQDAVFRAVRNGASDYTMRTGRGAFEF